jgi:hypothetical protein
MISNLSPDPSPLDAVTESSSPSGNTSAIDTWLDSIADHWQKSVKKIKKSDALAKSNKTVKQLFFGIDDDLIARVKPLADHVARSIKSEQAIEQLTELAESAAATADAFANTPLESFTSEVGGSEEPEAILIAALSALLVAHQLRNVALRGSDQHFERIARSLIKLQRSVIESDPQCVLSHQWLAFELPLIMAKELHAIKPFRKSGKAASKSFVEVTRNLLDSDGWPGSTCLQAFGPLAASWRRCIKLAKACNFKLGSSFYAQAEWIAEQFVRLHGPDKQLLFSWQSELKSRKSFVEFIVQLDPDGRVQQLAESSGLLGKKKKASSESPAVEPTCISEWASSAILRSSWSSGAPLLAIDFSNPHCFVELAAVERLISGRLALEVRVDGAVVDLAHKNFEVVCENVDDDGSYLELELQLENLTIHRQLLVSGSDEFFFFADSISKDQQAEIDYRLNIPLAREVSVIRENGTRELYLNLQGKGIQSLVLPLSLPEWTAERCRGLFSSEGDDSRDVNVLNVERTVQLPAEGGALYSPVFFDLNPNRSRQKRTWRSLTVAENLAIVPPEIAAAYRVQVAEEQWIFYRALREMGNRTFMGQNFAGDFFAARFLNDGKVKELVEIE